MDDNTNNPEIAHTIFVIKITNVPMSWHIINYTKYALKMTQKALKTAIDSNGKQFVTCEIVMTRF